MGLWLCGTLDPGGFPSGEVPGNPAGRWLSGLSGSHREGSAMAFAQRGAEYWNADYGVVRHVARVKRERALLRPPGVALFQPGQDRPRSGRRLSETQGYDDGRGRAMAWA